MTPGQAAYQLAQTFGMTSDYPWTDLDDGTRDEWHEIAQAAITAVPACPCGGMPGTACGAELTRRTEQIARYKTTLERIANGGLDRPWAVAVDALTAEG